MKKQIPPDGKPHRGSAEPDWNDICSEPIPDIFTCDCGQSWTVHWGQQGYNRCRACGRTYSAAEIEARTR